MSATFSTEDKDRLAELAQLMVNDSISDDEFAELGRLRVAQKKASADRQAAIAQTKQNVDALKILVTELYSAKEIQDAMGSKPAGKKASSGGTRTRTPKTGLTLFSVQPPKAKGAASTIMKGQAFPISFGAKFEWLKRQSGDLHDNLMKLADKSAEAQAHLKSAEGKAEVKKWVDWMKGQTFTAVPAKKTAKA
jgi:hypothetical protein